MKFFMVLVAIGAVVAAGYYFDVLPSVSELETTSDSDSDSGKAGAVAVEETAAEEKSVAKRPENPVPAPPSKALPSLRDAPELVPRRVKLLQPTTFPVVMDGRTVGTVELPVGSVVGVAGLSGGNVQLDHRGGRAEVPLSATDLVQRFEAAARAKATAARAGVASIPQNDVSRALGDSLVILENDRIVPFMDRDLGARRYYLIYFASGASGPCRRLSSQLVPLYRDVRGKTGAIEFILASTDSAPSAQESQMRETGMPWPAIRFDARDARGWVRRYAGPEYPCLVLIDGTGKIVSDTYEDGEFVGYAKVMVDLERVISGG
jgi:hypothetical protein